MRYTTRNASAPIRNREDFKTSGALYGSSVAYGVSTGRLPEEYVSSVQRATYVVMSYGTPIAWVTDGRWVRPDVRYSVTTSKHQGQCPLDGTLA